MSALALLIVLACAGDAGKESVEPRDPDGDGWLDVDDCDDEDPAVNPGADERCDYIDNDCDQLVDEEDAVDAITFYADLDGDGYGNPSYATQACQPPEQYVATGQDCDDEDVHVHPGVDDSCDEVDTDCDGVVDDDGTSTWYEDYDGDGHGRDDAPVRACTQPDGYAPLPDDCDDLDPDTYDEADEWCDGVDNDCDGQVDEDARDAGPWHLDADGDGYGVWGRADQICGVPAEGWAATNDDCDDDDPLVNPGVEETCNDVDDDCDGERDEWATDAPSWYADDDGDGHGDPARGRAACDAPSGWVADADDCDDADAAVSPEAEEVCDNEVDEDCDGATSCP